MKSLLTETSGEASEPAGGRDESEEVVRPDTPPPAPVVEEQANDYEQAVAAIKRLGGKRLTEGYKPSWSPDSLRIAFSRRESAMPRSWRPPDRDGVSAGLALGVLALDADSLGVGSGAARAGSHPCRVL